MDYCLPHISTDSSFPRATLPPITPSNNSEVDDDDDDLTALIAEPPPSPAHSPDAPSHLPTLFPPHLFPFDVYADTSFLPLARPLPQPLPPSSTPSSLSPSLPVAMDTDSPVISAISPASLTRAYTMLYLLNFSCPSSSYPLASPGLSNCPTSSYTTSTLLATLEKRRSGLLPLLDPFDSGDP